MNEVNSSNSSKDGFVTNLFIMLIRTPRLLLILHGMVSKSLSVNANF